MCTNRVAAATLAIGIAFAGVTLPAWAENTGKAVAFANAKLSLVQAIDIAERQLQGRATEAEFETERDTGRYHVQVLKDGEVTRYWIDAGSGQVIRSERQGRLEQAAKILGRDTVNPAALDASRITLAQAIGTSEQRVGGKAMKAEVEQKEGRLRYNTWVLKGGDLEEIEIDAVSDAAKAN